MDCWPFSTEREEFPLYRSMYVAKGVSTWLEMMLLQEWAGKLVIETLYTPLYIGKVCRRGQLLILLICCSLENVFIILQRGQNWIQRMLYKYFPILSKSGNICLIHAIWSYLHCMQIHVSCLDFSPEGLSLRCELGSHEGCVALIKGTPWGETWGLEPLTIFRGSGKICVVCCLLSVGSR